ncbi:MAG: hypothetical protein SXQ77_00810, partial [Halobacteria archaeon]|nr:hypothetical protein [Halobacteria archaeon]
MKQKNRQFGSKLTSIVTAVLIVSSMMIMPATATPSGIPGDVPDVDNQPHNFGQNTLNTNIEYAEEPVGAEALGEYVNNSSENASRSEDEGNEDAQDEDTEDADKDKEESQYKSSQKGTVSQSQDAHEKNTAENVSRNQNVEESNEDEEKSGNGNESQAGTRDEEVS